MTEVLDALKIVIGMAILILGLLIFFESGVFLDATLAILEAGYNPNALENAMLFGKVHTYSVVLICIGILITADGLLRPLIREFSRRQ